MMGGMFFTEGKRRPENRIKAARSGIHQHHSRRIGVLLALLGTGLATGHLHAQEALRQSIAGELSAEAQRNANSTIGYYNLLLGPTSWRFNASLAAEYNDNINLAEHGAEDDLILRPGVTTAMHWPVTEQNSLDLTLGMGYSAYLFHPERDTIYINPGSGVAFDVYVGDFAFNFHDRISITENPYENPTSGGSGSTDLENTLGVGTTWDLNKAVLTLGYDHVDYVSLNGSSGQPDGSSENFSFTAGMKIRPELVTGVEAGGSLASYDQTSTTAVDGMAQWNAGVFARLQISEYLNLRASGGYTMILPGTPASTNILVKDSGDFYFQVLLAHHVNRFLDYTLSAGRSIDLQYYGQPHDRYYARWNPDWKFLHKFSLATPLWWEHGSQLYGNTTTYDQVGVGITLGRQLTEKLSGNVYYRFIKEFSDEASWNYNNNIVGLSLAYQF